MHSVLVLLLAAVVQKPAPVENVSTFPPRSAEEERKALHVPEGFEIQLVAAEPEIQKPMNIAFDDRGRLWTTGSFEYPFLPKKGARPADSVRILEDFGPDGHARKVTVFADGLTIPIGLLPLPAGNGALVFSIPSIDLFLDTDGDGRADVRRPLYQMYGSNDTHGMTGSFSWGMDGWIYACHGFLNSSTVRGSDGKAITMNSGNVYRFQLDGTHAEYFTHGQVNPFGLSFDARGDLYSSDCHSQPIYMLLRGAYYPSFGKPDDGLGFGPEMIDHGHGSTAIDGATYYAADQFPQAFRGNVFIGNVVTNRINRDRLEWRGSSPWAVEEPDLVWSEDNWFRPVDTELGPDGALYVADFYNRIIGHYEVPLLHPGRDHKHGRIWRIVYRGKEGKEAPRVPRTDWTKAGMPELVEGLGHPNLVVRTKATNQLVNRPVKDVSAALKNVVGSDETAKRRAHALWVLHRVGTLGDATLKGAAEASDPFVRIHAMRVLGERDAPARVLMTAAREALEDGDPFVRRAAAEALGRHPDFDNVHPLLALRGSVPKEDTHQLHVVRMALRDQFRTSDAWTRLESIELNPRDARFIADIATGVPSADSAHYLLQHLDPSEDPRERQFRFVHHIARYGDKDASQALLVYYRKRSQDGLTQRAEMLKAIQQGTQERGAPVGGELRGLALELAQALLNSAHDQDVVAGIKVTNEFALGELRGTLEALVNRATASDAKRQAALAAVVAMDPKGALPLLGKILNESTATLGLRERGATMLAEIDHADARRTLIEALPTAPSQVQTAIATGLAMRRPGAEALLEVIASGKGSARLLQEPTVSSRLTNTGIEGLSERVTKLLEGLPPADQKLRELTERRRKAFAASSRDVALGAKVFEQHCAACHQIAGKGARVGPQLDGVGVRGVDRLLEDTLDPSRNVDQAFRISTLALANGQVVTGLLMREEGAVLVLADPQGKELRVAKTDVEERTNSQLSLMPANLADQIPEADYYHLLGYLLSQRQEASKGAR